MNKKISFKKTPFINISPTEKEFINRAEADHQFNKNSQMTSFLIRMPKETKKRLKELSYLTEDNMNQICLEAIDEYMKKSKDIKI